jgi:hypothetical protein
MISGGRKRMIMKEMMGMANQIESYGMRNKVFMD